MWLFPCKFSCELWLSTVRRQGVHRTLTPRSTAVILYIRRCTYSHGNVCACWSLDLDPGSETGSGTRLSYTEEYGVVHERSNHTRKNTAYYTNISPKQQLVGYNVITVPCHPQAPSPLAGSLTHHSHNHTAPHTCPLTLCTIPIYGCLKQYGYLSCILINRTG